MVRVKQQIADWLARRGCAEVDAAVFEELKRAFPKTSPKTLRHALLGCGLPLAPMVEGVNQSSFDDLARTLLILAREYEESDSHRRGEIRSLVITAKTHAGFAAKNPKVTEDRRAEKTEMLLWLLTWLENPPLIETWLPLRRAQRR